jgi:acylphosphatase
MSQIGAELRIRGLVQGVGYRWFFIHKATDLGLTGWVRNVPDGTVSAVVEGDRSLVEALIEEARIGPYSAQVTDVDIKWVPYSGQYRNMDVVR